MKNIITNYGVMLFTYVLFNSCGGNETKETITTKEVKPVDICRCLTEPVNSVWYSQNKGVCREAISKELGVENYEKINFSKERELNRKWNQLVEKCIGSNKIETVVETVDKNNEIIKQIGTSYGYIWESINNEAQIYTTLAFDELKFRTTNYSMNYQSNSENFIKLINLTGSWHLIDYINAEGSYDQNNVSVNWKFSKDYSNLMNNKGVVFKRIKVTANEAYCQ